MYCTRWHSRSEEHNKNSSHDPVISLSINPSLSMSSRQGGKLKPLKVGGLLCFHFRMLIYRLTQAPKKEKQEETEEEKAFKEKQKAEAAAAKLAREKGSFLP